MLYSIPMKKEIYSVASRKLTDEELRQVPYEVLHEARVYFDLPENNGGPRKWPSYEAFIGFQIAKVTLIYQLDREQLQYVVEQSYKLK
jgi:hypothetical protein